MPIFVHHTSNACLTIASCSIKLAQFWRRHSTPLNIALAASLFLWFYVHSPHLPSGTAAGWWGWWDQRQYKIAAETLRRFDLPQSEYPWGYPLLGALFGAVFPSNPFFVVNILCFVLIWLSTCKIIEKHTQSFEASAITFFSFLAVPALIDSCIIIPWNHLPLWAFIYLTLSGSIQNETYYKSAIFFCVVFLSWLSRPIDTTLFCLSSLPFLCHTAASPSWRRTISATLLALSCAAGTTLLLNVLAFGSIDTPYDATNRAIGASITCLPLHLYTTFIDPLLYYGNTAFGGRLKPLGIFSLIPLLIPALSGLLLWFLTSKDKKRLVFSVLPTVTLLLFYLSTNFEDPLIMWTYNGYRYFWWIPHFVLLMGYLGFRTSLPRVSKQIVLRFLVLSLPLYVLSCFGMQEHLLSSGPIAAPMPDASNTAILFRLPRSTQSVRALRLHFSADMTTLNLPTYHTHTTLKTGPVTLRYWKDYTLIADKKFVNFVFHNTPLPLAGQEIHLTLPHKFKTTATPRAWHAISSTIFFDPLRIVRILRNTHHQLPLAPTLPRN